MGDCPHCHSFNGAPTCSSCKTYLRIGGLLQSGKLSRYQEGSVLTALRNCAGALSDLVEIGVPGPFGSGVPDKEAEIGRSPLKEAEKNKEGPPKEEADEEKAGKKEKSKEKKPKGDKEARKTEKRDKRSKKKNPSKSPDKKADKEGKERGERGPALESARSRKTLTGREKSESPRDRRDREERPRGDKRPREERVEENLDREVEEDPRRFELRQIPIRGSAGRRSYDGPIPAGSRPPPEPAGSPPKEDRDSRNYGRSSGSSGHRNPDRWKGHNHYLRGVNYWKNRKRHPR